MGDGASVVDLKMVWLPQCHAISLMLVPTVPTGPVNFQSSQKLSVRIDMVHALQTSPRSRFCAYDAGRHVAPAESPSGSAISRHTSS